MIKPGQIVIHFVDEPTDGASYILASVATVAAQLPA
jgi:hypothetical protein